MDKFRVTRGKVYWHRKVFSAGDYLPEDFTEKDIYRTLYPSRIEKVTVAETPKVETKTETKTPVKAETKAIVQTKTPVKAETPTGKPAPTTNTGTTKKET